MFYVPSAVPVIAGSATTISGASNGPIHGEVLVRPFMTIATYRTTLARLETDLPPVLEELRAMDLRRRRPFVIVDEPLTKRFVQFGRIVEAHPGDVEKGIAPAGEMAFDVPALNIYLEGFGNDPAEGARRAADILRQWLPDEAELVVTLDGEPLD
jgi:hypothetical protein